MRRILIMIVLGIGSIEADPLIHPYVSSTLIHDRIGSHAQYDAGNLWGLSIGIQIPLSDTWRLDLSHTSDPLSTLDHPYARGYACSLSMGEEWSLAYENERTNGTFTPHGSIPIYSNDGYSTLNTSIPYTHTRESYRLRWEYIGIQYERQAFPIFLEETLYPDAQMKSFGIDLGQHAPNLNETTLGWQPYGMIRLWGVTHLDLNQYTSFEHPHHSLFNTQYALGVSYRTYVGRYMLLYSLGWSATYYYLLDQETQSTSTGTAEADLIALLFLPLSGDTIVHDIRYQSTLSFLF